MATKITIIGAGNVGATIANDLIAMRIAAEVLLIDINEPKAFGEAMDIYQGVGFTSPAVVRSGHYEDAVGSSIVIITSGIARKPGQTRLDLAQTNVNILRQIAPQIVRFAPDAVYIIVSNPVDIMTYAFCQLSGVPENHIIGSGTVLDTVRLQTELAQQFRISPHNVHACVYGEHGDSSFVPWSLATIASNPISRYKANAPQPESIPFHDNYAEIEEKVHNSGALVIKSKGATYYAAAFAVCHLVSSILNGTGTAVTVSTMMHGEYGISDVCLSVMNILDSTGVRGKVLNDLTGDELQKLRFSAEKLKQTIASIEI